MVVAGNVDMTIGAGARMVRTQNLSQGWGWLHAYGSIYWAPSVVPVVKLDLPVYRSGALLLTTMTA